MGALLQFKVHWCQRLRTVQITRETSTNIQSYIP